jgi:hypothetical protein
MHARADAQPPQMPELLTAVPARRAIHSPWYDRPSQPHTTRGSLGQASGFVRHTPCVRPCEHSMWQYSWLRQSLEALHAAGQSPELLTAVPARRAIHSPWYDRPSQPHTTVGSLGQPAGFLRHTPCVWLREHSMWQYSWLLPQSLEALHAAPTTASSASAADAVSSSASALQPAAASVPSPANRPTIRNEILNFIRCTFRLDGTMPSPLRGE